jgi:hypothetical protein
MLQPRVVTPTMKLFLVLPHNRIFATVMSHNVNMIEACRKGRDPQTENHCSRGCWSRGLNGANSMLLSLLWPCRQESDAEETIPSKSIIHFLPGRYFWIKPILFVAVYKEQARKYPQGGAYEHSIFTDTQNRVYLRKVKTLWDRLELTNCCLQTRLAVIDLYLKLFMH